MRVGDDNSEMREKKILSQIVCYFQPLISYNKNNYNLISSCHDAFAHNNSADLIKCQILSERRRCWILVSGTELTVLSFCSIMVVRCWQFSTFTILVNASLVYLLVIKDGPSLYLNTLQPSGVLKI